MILRYFIVYLLVFFSFWVSISYAAISFTLTPIRYELELNPGESVTLPASIKNNGTWSVTLPTAVSDFVSNGDGWTPSFVRKSELVFPDQQLSTWITLSASEISLAPWEEGTIYFTINIPTTATPGWHYGAVFFKNAGSESGWWNISVNVDYGILILVTVSWEIKVGAEIDEPIISIGGSIKNPLIWDDNIQNNGEGTWSAWYIGNDDNGKPLYQYKDSCPLWDFTSSNYDGKCIDNPFWNNDSQDIWNNEPLLFSDDFEVAFSFPIKNTGNTHIKPTGKITLTDEDGKVIKAIGKELIENERGAIIGEKIVDYIPINDEWGNILPSTRRVFESVWRWFPYKSYDDEWNQVLNYWTPSEYYTKKNKEKAGFLMFWDRVSEVRQNKMITADIELTYYDEKWNPINFNTAKEFPIQYIEQKVEFNPYIILALLLLSVVGIMTLLAVKWWFVVVKAHKCWNCHKKIKSHWETCPYCKSIQNKKKHKKYIKQVSINTPIQTRNKKKHSKENKKVSKK